MGSMNKRIINQELSILWSNLRLKVSMSLKTYWKLPFVVGYVEVPISRIKPYITCAVHWNHCILILHTKITTYVLQLLFRQEVPLILITNQGTFAFFTLNPTPISRCLVDKKKVVLILYEERIIAHKHTSSIQHVCLWPIHLKCLD